jgi:hypothetical protein
MASLSKFNILIIDFPEVYELGECLMRAGATVHVVSRGGALVLACNKRIDVAFIAFGVDAGTRHLCELLNGFGVGQIIVTAGDVGSLSKEREVAPKSVRGSTAISQIKQPAPSYLQ